MLVHFSYYIWWSTIYNMIHICFNCSCAYGEHPCLHVKIRKWQKIKINRIQRFICLDVMRSIHISQRRWKTNMNMVLYKLSPSWLYATMRKKMEENPETREEVKVSQIYVIVLFHFLMQWVYLSVGVLPLIQWVATHPTPRPHLARRASTFACQTGRLMPPPFGYPIQQHIFYQK